jgi:hypothetical protein
MRFAADPFVEQRILDWQRWTIDTFQPDGLRFDAALNVRAVRIVCQQHVNAVSPYGPSRFTKAHGICLCVCVCA